MEALKAKRARIKGSLTRTATFINTITPQTTIQELTSRFEKLDEFWKEFMEVEDDLCANFYNDPQFVDQSTEFEEFENKYHQVKAALKQVIDQRIPQSQQTHHDIITNLVDQQNTFLNRLNSSHLPNQNQSPLNTSHQNSSAFSEVRLPKVNIPTFSGDYREWMGFEDLFTSLIQNNASLTGAQKFQYLKGLLKGEAATLIRHLPCNDSSYSEAWDKLKKGYGKTSQIIQSFIKTFMDLPCVSQVSSNSLRKLSNTADEVIRGLKSLGPSAEGRGHWLLFILTNKLYHETKQAWAQRVTERDQNNQPTIQELLDFINRKCESLESCPIRKPTASLPRTFALTTTPASLSVQPCILCQSEHALYQCGNFKSLDVTSRRDFAVKNSVCFNCLHVGHSATRCRSKLSCHYCSRRHHSLLHPNRNNSSETSLISTSTSANAMPQDEKEITSPKSNALSSGSAHSQTINTTVFQSHSSLGISLLPTAIIYVRDNQGSLLPCRALLDSGSQVSLITESCVQRLNISRKHARIPISGIAASEAGVTRGVVQLQLFSKLTSQPILNLSAYVLSRLTSRRPPITVSAEDWSYIKSLDLADPEFYKCGEIDIIIGIDKFFDILQESKIISTDKRTLAQSTIFGWVIAGQISQLNIEENVSLLSYHFHADLDNILRKFWEIGELNAISNKLRTDEENAAENHFVQTHSRNHEGRFIVKLPFKKSQVDFGNSLNAAVSRLHHMERRFKSNPEFKKQYAAFLKEYLHLGHMTAVPRERIDVNSLYLPHHGVIKTSSTTTKLRVVFDGSCSTSNGISLNDSLLVGPTIQQDLIAILVRFRLYRFALTADIAKMYRQVLVHQNDANFQRIVWRESSREPIQHFQLNTVTYGTSAAPFLATRSLFQLAEDEKLNFPYATKLLKRDFYVDDFMSGAHSISEAIQIVHDLSSLLKAGGFDLRKWASNNALILENISPDKREVSPLTVQSNESSIKVLGIKWHPAQDTFSFTVSLDPHVVCTKRKILSEVSKIFDPLGWLTPSIILAKTLFQRLWLLHLDWDSPISPEISNQWISLRQQLIHFKELNIPRWIGTTTTKFQLHGFCDASESAYAAVIYCRSISSDNGVRINLVAAKSRVAPIKQVSLPRLELCGALLLTRLLNFIKESFEISDVETVAWTDSTIVLAWLEDHPRRWKTFIANRTTEIIETLPRRHWRHVPTAENPADCASRGLLPKTLLQQSLWWHGPIWLSREEDSWPRPPCHNPDMHNADMEERKNTICLHPVQADIKWFNELCSKYSSFMKLIRIVAYCLRFIKFTRRDRQEISPGFLTSREIKNSLQLCIKLGQAETFTHELRELQSNRNIKTSNKISSLVPFIHNDGLLRVGGRINESLCSFDTKHPILLSKHHIISTLIIQHLHAKHLHAGSTLLSSILRQQYWILGERNLIRKIIHKCVICFRYKRHANEQLMGNLPYYRIQASPPFLKTGCDYAGPITLINHKGRGARETKGYICVFVCMAVKAIHLELVTDMTTDAFIASLRRFMSRRGKCSDIFSDTGTNFVGAARRLNKLHNSAVYAHNIAIAKVLAEDHITWHFIPPYAPNFGGLWESNIKSIKQHLKRVIGNARLTYEEMSTFLCQVEGVLNSRPLCSQSNLDPNIEPLTPSHFLVGRTLTSIPEPDLKEVNPSRLNRMAASAADASRILGPMAQRISYVVADS